MSRAREIIVNGFVGWVLLAAVACWRWPGAIRPLTFLIIPALVVIMLGMGLTLTPADFRMILQRPQGVAIGVLAQYTVMPLAAWILASLLPLDPALAAGVILVGTCPSGTASNVMSYLAGGDVALSVSITTAGTLLAPILTPWMTKVLAGQWVAVQPAALFFDVVKIVVLPVAFGVGLRRVLGDQIKGILAWLPAISCLAIIGVIGIIVAANAGAISSLGLTVLVVVVLHNGLGLGIGYGAARALKLNEAQSRTVALEVGMQNSGLAVALAARHFGALAALPGALFSVWQNITAPALAGRWRRQKIRSARSARGAHQSSPSI